MIFVIDCSEAMLAANEYNEGNDSSVTTVFKAALGFMKTKVISSESDKIGIVLYNCKDEKMSTSKENVKVLFTLDTPTAENIKKIEAISKSVQQDITASAQPSHFSDVLWTCQSQFQHDSNRIFIFSDNADPTNGDQAETQKCLSLAKDLEEAEGRRQEEAGRRSWSNAGGEVTLPFEPGHGDRY